MIVGMLLGLRGMMGERWLRRVWSTALCGAVAGLGLLTPVRADEPGQSSPPSSDRQTYPFVTHAEFFSRATKRSETLDPQIFIQQAALPEGVGPQGIAHVAGLRPAEPEDVPELVAYNARGHSLKFTLARWFLASGTATLQRRDDGTQRVTCRFEKLVPFGIYSLFKISFTPAGAVFTPLDGEGIANTFTAGGDGGYVSSVLAPAPLAAGDAIVLVYHSDARGHGKARGELGITAHQQLIVRLPQSS